MTDNKDLSDIIPPVDRDVLEGELSEDRFVKNTNKGGNKIYIINHHNSPNVMREIGRLREVSFRQAGGGTGLELDIDDYDTSDRCYDQLVVYDEEEREIIGGYRFITGEKAYSEEDQSFSLSTAHYFDFSEKMKSDYLPYSIELGRSWVQPKFQPANNPRKGVFALMNIWDGLGCLVVQYPEVRYFFGKVTMYTNYNKEARDILLAFLEHYFPDDTGLCQPKPELQIGFDNKLFKEHFGDNTPYQDGFKLLNKLLKERGEWIPPLINIYMNLSSTMKTLGTSINPEFGSVEETGLLVTIADIHQEIKDRHINY